ncbi:hypothetical protein JOC77_001604 [Peribacillus deserti]|uniref:Uncharacterized protein n=1 Tax=Peribacillus deserti TaxID=673318 RepID=A0ABS2QG94_9BACI|nr:hypothetical protein [Peribacillus deserti]
MRFRIISLLLICVVFLNGCFNNSEKPFSIKIPDIHEYSILYIQGVDENSVIDRINQQVHNGPYSNKTIY